MRKLILVSLILICSACSGGGSSSGAGSAIPETRPLNGATGTPTTSPSIPAQGSTVYRGMDTAQPGGTWDGDRDKPKTVIVKIIKDHN